MRESNSTIPKREKERKAFWMKKGHASWAVAYWLEVFSFLLYVMKYALQQLGPDQWACQFQSYRDPLVLINWRAQCTRRSASGLHTLPDYVRYKLSSQCMSANYKQLIVCWQTTSSSIIPSWHCKWTIAFERQYFRMCQNHYTGWGAQNYWLGCPKLSNWSNGMRPQGGKALLWPLCA